jgi:hypothetical protein
MMRYQWTPSIGHAGRRKRLVEGTETEEIRD